MKKRVGTVKRDTTETRIDIELAVDGSGENDIETGIPFFDHMLTLFAKHGLFDLKIQATGDINVDAHHTVEDVGICLGKAFQEALADKKGINRYGFALVPMDESLSLVALDISGRPYLEYDVDMPVEVIGTFDTPLVEEYLQALCNNTGMTLHVKMLNGKNTHHMIEAVFKGLGKALDMATMIDPRVKDIPSTKGRL
jgi:imidazoleglycerol-phosphate dehydratase